MTASPIYPHGLPSQTMDPSQINGEGHAHIASSDWYPPPSYTYNEQYITPYPTSTEENPPWPHSARAPIPSLPFGSIQQAQQQHQQQLGLNADPNRPRSSQSTYGSDYAQWPTSTGLGIQYSAAHAGPTPVSSTFPPSVFQTYPIGEQSPQTFPASTPPELQQPQPLRAYASTPSLKRRRAESEDATNEATVKPGTPLNSAQRKRKRTSSVVSADLNEDDRFLVQLKEDENLPWKEIATRFQTDKGRTFQVAALQMRYKRLREKFRVWEEADVSALKLAHEYWEKYKWEIISAKMLDFGISERWPARHCRSKWQEYETTLTATTGTTTAQLLTSSITLPPTTASTPASHHMTLTSNTPANNPSSTPILHHNLPPTLTAAAIAAANHSTDSKGLAGAPHMTPTLRSVSQYSAMVPSPNLGHQTLSSKTAVGGQTPRQQYSFLPSSGLQPQYHHHHHYPQQPTVRAASYSGETNYQTGAGNYNTTQQQHRGQGGQYQGSP